MKKIYIYSLDSSNNNKKLKTALNIELKERELVFNGDGFTIYRD
jgi:hypothetical protein